MKPTILLIFLIITQSSFAQKDEILNSEWFGDFGSYWKFDTEKKTAILLPDSAVYHYILYGNRIDFRTHLYPRNKLSNSFYFDFTIKEDTLSLSKFPYKLYRNRFDFNSSFDSIQVHIPDKYATLTVYSNKKLLLRFPPSPNSILLGFYSGQMDSSQWLTFKEKISQVLMIDRTHNDSRHVSSSDGRPPNLLKIYYNQDYQYWQYWQRLPQKSKQILNDFYSKEIENMTFYQSDSKGNKDFRYRCYTYCYPQEYFKGRVLQKMYSEKSNRFYYHFVSEQKDTLLMFSDNELPDSTVIGVCTSKETDKFLDLATRSDTSINEYYKIIDYVFPIETLPFFKHKYFYQNMGILPWRNKNLKREMRRFEKSEEALFLLGLPK